MTFPARVEDNPAFLNFKSESGRVLYGEDIYVGYRYYEKTKLAPLFPFGHGLSYTNFSHSNLQLSHNAKFITITLDVKNAGEFNGAEVIQVYVSQSSPAISRPAKELKGFEKTFLEKGEEKVVSVKIPTKYATSYWDESRAAWISEKDNYKVLVGNSSTGPFLESSFTTKSTFYWTGI
jgi:beta-glucosidase